MVNVKRGFRRLAWVITALALPAVAWLAYESSSHRVGYDARLLSRDDTVDHIWQKPVHIENLGILYFPVSSSDSEIVAEVRRRFTLRTNPAAFKKEAGKYAISEFAAEVRSKQRAGDSRLDEFVNLPDVELTEKILAKYPEYQSWVTFHRFKMEPRSQRRPMWAAAVSLVSIAVLALLLQGGISIVGWIVAGFRATESDRS